MIFIIWVREEEKTKTDITLPYIAFFYHVLAILFSSFINLLSIFFCFVLLFYFHFYFHYFLNYYPDWLSKALNIFLSPV